MSRRRPVRHNVISHTRDGKRVDSYNRGSGHPSNKRRGSKIVGTDFKGGARNIESYLNRFIKNFNRARSRNKVLGYWEPVEIDIDGNKISFEMYLAIGSSKEDMQDMIYNVDVVPSGNVYKAILKVYDGKTDKDLPIRTAVGSTLLGAVQSLEQFKAPKFIERFKEYSII